MYEAIQTPVEVKGKIVKAWAVVDEQGVVRRAYTSKLIDDPQGGAEAYAAELNATEDAPDDLPTFVMPTFGESFSSIEPHHCPEGFDPACLFLLALNEANLFDIDGRCKGCGAIPPHNAHREHRDDHRIEVSRLRREGRDRSQGKTRRSDFSGLEGKPTELARAMREKGASYKEIADEFWARDIKTPRGKDRWSTTSVMRMLREFPLKGKG